MKTIIAFITLLSFSNFSAYTQDFEEINDIIIQDNNIYIKVYVNSKGPYNFIFDSGASGIGRIDQHLISELGLKVVDSIENSDGHNIKTEPLIGIEKLKFGRIELKNISLMSRDYNKKKKDIPIDGFIGRDFFEDYLLTIDCPNRKMIVSKDSLNVLEKDILPYTKPFYIKGRVGSIDTTFLFDTGSNLSLHFPKSIIDRLHFENTSNKIMARRANTEFILQEAILKDDLKLGLIKAKNQTIFYSEKATWINVGMDFMKHYKITFDQKRKLVKIE